VSDEFTVRVCRVHHRELHRSGDEAAWRQRLNIDPLPVALRVWQHTRADGCWRRYGMADPTRCWPYPGGSAESGGRYQPKRSTTFACNNCSARINLDWVGRASVHRGRVLFLVIAAYRCIISISRFIGGCLRRRHPSLIIFRKPQGNPQTSSSRSVARLQASHLVYC
jgi:hypothetical protein